MAMLSRALATQYLPYLDYRTFEAILCE